MKHIADFGSLSVESKLNLLESDLKEGDILLFQYYNKGSLDSKELIDEYFEYYCDDIIHYYDSTLRFRIDEAVLNELMKSQEISKEINEAKKKGKAQGLFKQIKEGDFKNISKITIDNIKTIVCTKIFKENINIERYKYVTERLYGKTCWILDERGKVQDDTGAIWYKPANRKEYLEILNKYPLFSCISLEIGENLEKFTFGYTTLETADNYDLLIFNQD